MRGGGQATGKPGELETKTFGAGPSEEPRTIGRRRGRGAPRILGALAVFLGTSLLLSAWVALIGAATAALAAHLFAGRYQYLLISHQSTARRLEWLRAKWLALGKTDADTEQRNRFIVDCESVISVENSAWMAELGDARQRKPAT